MALDLEGLTWSELATCRWPQFASMIWDLDPAPAPEVIIGFHGLLGWTRKWKSGFGYALGPFRAEAAEVFIAGSRAAEIFVAGQAEASVFLPGANVAEVSGA